MVIASWFVVCCVVALAVATEPTIFLSFRHGVLDGPNADIYINDKLIWANVTAGTLKPYYNAQTFAVENGSIAQIGVMVAGTQTSYFGSGVAGAFRATPGFQSAYLFIYGSFYDTILGVQKSARFNYDLPVADSVNTALRVMYGGSFFNETVHVTLSRLSTSTSYGTYSKYSDSVVSSSSGSFYSIVPSGTYLVQIQSVENSGDVYSLNVTVAKSSAYSVVIMGSFDNQPNTFPLSAQLVSEPQYSQPNENKTTDGDGVSKRWITYGVPVAVVGACVVGVMAYVIGRKQGASREVGDKAPLKGYMS